MERVNKKIIDNILHRTLKDIFWDMVAGKDTDADIHAVESCSAFYGADAGEHLVSIIEIQKHKEQANEASIRRYEAFTEINKSLIDLKG